MTFGYERLDVTKLAKRLIKEMYLLTKSFPKHEQYGLSSQIRRASVSVLLNIAEGSNRKSRKEYARFIRISIASLIEVDCGCKLAIDLRLMVSKKSEDLTLTVQELYFKLIGLEKYLRKK